MPICLGDFPLGGGGRVAQDLVQRLEIGCPASSSVFAHGELLKLPGPLFLPLKNRENIVGLWGRGNVAEPVTALDTGRLEF